VFGIAPKNRFANGGLLVAIVGGDGAGKTTVVDGLSHWFSGKFEVKKLHMGKPAWSWTTIVLRGILKVGTVLHLYPFEGDVYEQASQPHGIPWFIRTVCAARDRYLTYLQARRLSSNGTLVLCDRYSLMGFMNMDGPLCETALANLQKKSKLLKFLTEKEKFYYQQIQLSDLLIVLKLDPEIAVQRKTEETEASVRARSSEVWGLDWEKVSGFSVDASRSREEALSQVKALVWEHL
jgi:thymidylate kinase